MHKISSNSLLIIAMVSLVAAGLLQGDLEALPGVTPDDTTVVVPFQMLPSNHMVVDAKLNGKGPFRFIFDLGAPVTLLTNTAAEDSGAVGKGTPKSLFMAMRGATQVDRLQMGDLVAKDIPVMVMDHPALKVLGGMFSRPLSGIIGYTFWAHYRMTIDYQAKKMTFTPIDFEVQDLMKDLPARMSGPKRAKTIVLAPKGVWGLTIAEPTAGSGLMGVPVTAVVTDSPVAVAGLKPNDVLLSIDGRWTTSVADTFAAAETVAPGQTVEVRLMRDGQEVHVQVTPKDGL